jgi:hypothetical protein
MKHVSKTTLTAMLVPALALGAAGFAGAQSTGSMQTAPHGAYATGGGANAQTASPNSGMGAGGATNARPNKADTSSAVTHTQAMRGGVNAAASSTGGMNAQGSAHNDMARGSTKPMAQTNMSNMMASGSGSDAKTYIFDALDTNRDGKLSRAEVTHNSNLARQARTLDRNHDGNISRDEFAQYKR